VERERSETGGEVKDSTEGVGTRRLCDGGSVGRVGGGADVEGANV